MNNYHLAIDIGASSGRHILGRVVNGKLTLEEIYRFDNEMKTENGHLCWDIAAIFDEVVRGIEKCKTLGKIPETIAIDTWGVDYVLLDEDDAEILPAYAYRDSRTVGVPEKIDRIIPREELYARTGIAPLEINTIYQLYCDKLSGKLDDAAHFLMMPDYLSYKLTGVMANEYTNATTTSLVNAATNEWDDELINLLGFNRNMFLPLCAPATPLSGFCEDVKRRVGFDATVIHAPSHDTASAVAACPIDDESVYISSGTWSLIGTENISPILTKDALTGGFTNEGGIEYRYRFLENIIGMWFFQNIRKNLDKKYTYDEMMNMARASCYDKLINTGDAAFLAPDNMIDAVKSALGVDDIPLGDLLASIYLSLAKSYDTAIKTIENHSNKQIKNILIVGGGSKDRYLNELTASVTGKRVMTGLEEATAVGNILSQIIYSTGISLNDGRELIKQSFSIGEAK